ncbi:restriction endonuclease subunit S [Olsenella uli]|uniref:restriction endonuclease subunit S n=1 Tax=Olsenella uli TaxID=133926 RepID=UPI00241FE56E|nr:restriction endonuclease subunit S [Olsenella uli]
MKNSGLSWLGDIPADWELLYPKQLFQVRKERAREDDVMLTASQHLGMISQDEFMEAESYTPVAVEKGHDILKHVEPGDFVISMRSFQGGLEYSRVRGKMSSAYLALYSTDERVEDEYFKWLFKSDGYISSLQSTSNLVRDGQALRFANFIQVFLPLPPSSEQRAIAAYLDKACADVDSAIEAAEDSIGEYQSYRKAVVYRVATAGLQATEAKPSGIDWQPTIPNSWRVVRGKDVLTLLSRPITDDDGIITCFRDGVVTLRSNRREDGFTVALKEIGYQGIEPGDLVVHGMDGFAGSIGISDSRGKSSPVLNVMDSSQNKRYLMYYLRALAYKDVYLALATGIRVRSCNLNWNKIATLLILLPPAEEQEEIAAYLDIECSRIDAAIAAKRSIIDELKAYKKSLVYEYVTGKREMPCQ